MSQSLKQTTLNFSRWNKRPRTDDNQDGDRSIRLTPPSSSIPSPDEARRSKFSQTHATPLSIAPSVKVQSADTWSDPDIPLLKAASVSFTSSDLPLSSSSQRIVRNGERMVTNSDEDEDSSSLEDLDNMIRLKEPENSEGFLEQTGKVPRGGSGAPERTSGRGKAARNSSLVAKGTEYKYSLAVLAEQRRHLQASGENVAKINAILEARRQAQPLVGQNSSMNGLHNESAIDAVMNNRGDEEDVDRLKDALRRTEALHRDKTWSFFRAETEDEIIGGPPEFPNLEDSQLRPILQNVISRQQAFLNGFVEDFATKKDLPDELLLWIIESTCSERRQELRFSYMRIVEELGLRKDDILSPQRINNLFRRIGASDEALEMQKPITSSPTVSEGADSTLQDHLLPLLGLIHALAGALRPDSCVHAICTLCRLLLDHQVVGNCSVVTAINETLNGLIESIPNLLNEQVLQDALLTIHGSVDDPALCLQLVRNLPVYTSRMAVFRRRLALAFFFQDTDYLKTPEEDLTVDMTSIAAYIQTPRFTISKKTDYAQLTASMAMLDIGIDAGDPLLPFPTSKEEQKFDSAVDLLSGRLKGLSTQIVGGSALNMQRTEAKEIIDALQRRLSCAVRSKPLSKKSILLDPAASHEAEKERMMDYLNQAKSKAFGGSLTDVTDKNINQISTYE